MADVFFHSLKCVVLERTWTIRGHVCSFLFLFFNRLMRTLQLFFFGWFYIIDQIVSARPWQFVGNILSRAQKITFN